MPRDAWPSLSADLADFECAARGHRLEGGGGAIHRAILDAVRSGPVEALRYGVGRLIARGSRCTDAVDQLRSAVPVWQATRVVSMLIALEYLRITEKRPPRHARISAMVRACDQLREAVQAATKAN